MRFNLLYRSLNKKGKENTIPVLFKNACEQQGVEFVGIDASDLGKSFTLSTLPKLGKGDLIYRSAVGPTVSIAEKMMVNDDVMSFYTTWQSVNLTRVASWFTHKKFGLPVVPTFPDIPSSAEELHQVVERLGSFPIIVKVTGGSLGVGVMRIDSMKSLQSVLDYLVSTKAVAMLRRYIPHDFYVRAVVVGDRVVASHATYVAEGEFRTNVLNGNVEQQRREARVLPEEIQNIAVQAVRTLGLETGGVDLLYDKDNQPYIAEVNFPNDFATTQKVTGIDIAGEMVAYLVKKAGK
ncbi:TPA: hypothetical protein DEP58_03535 [Patescibacteria group bacterium]|nr:MAG: Alpha-L-glutamate ligase, RimK family [Parcubacteria group bacterium GW2011_GWD2_42_14]HCC05351.1 hypothetical protein [Patescibacteria group bacterium]